MNKNVVFGRGIPQISQLTNIMSFGRSITESLRGRHCGERGGGPSGVTDAILAGGSAALPIFMGCMPDRSNHSGHPTRDALEDANQAALTRRFRTAPRQHKSILENSTEKALQSNRLPSRIFEHIARKTLKGISIYKGFPFVREILV